jgi:hypothetical protein
MQWPVAFLAAVCVAAAAFLVSRCDTRVTVGGDTYGVAHASAPSRQDLSNKEVLDSWTRALHTTPAPAGNRWKPMKPRATGEFGCEPGQTRVNPQTGRLQGCGR